MAAMTMTPMTQLLYARRSVRLPMSGNFAVQLGIKSEDQTTQLTTVF